MDNEIFVLMRRTPSLAEVMTGAYGFLSAAVDSYLHSPEIGTEGLAHDFYAIQQEVANAVQRVISQQGIPPEELIKGVRETALEMGLTAENAGEVARRAVKLVFPITRVTDS